MQDLQIETEKKTTITCEHHNYVMQTVATLAFESKTTVIFSILQYSDLQWQHVWQTGLTNHSPGIHMPLHT
jgi:hypothetical protein